MAKAVSGEMDHSELDSKLNTVTELFLQNDFAGVIDTIDECERLSESQPPLHPHCYAWRGLAQCFDARFEDAVSGYQTALETDPEHQQANLNLSYILASCPDSSLQDAELAIDHARLICELTNWKQWHALKALAGALARAGDFPNAKRQALRAGKFVPDAQEWRVTRLLELINYQQPFTADPGDDIRKLRSDWGQ